MVDLTHLTSQANQMIANLPLGAAAGRHTFHHLPTKHDDGIPTLHLDDNCYRLTSADTTDTTHRQLTEALGHICPRCCDGDPADPTTVLRNGLIQLHDRLTHIADPQHQSRHRTRPLQPAPAGDVADHTILQLVDTLHHLHLLNNWVNNHTSRPEAELRSYIQQAAIELADTHNQLRRQLTVNWADMLALQARQHLDHSRGQPTDLQVRQQQIDDLHTLARKGADNPHRLHSRTMRAVAGLIATRSWPNIHQQALQQLHTTADLTDNDLQLAADHYIPTLLGRITAQTAAADAEQQLRPRIVVLSDAARAIGASVWPLLTCATTRSLLQPHTYLQVPAVFATRMIQANSERVQVTDLGWADQLLPTNDRHLRRAVMATAGQQLAETPNHPNLRTAVDMLEATHTALTG